MATGWAGHGQAASNRPVIAGNTSGKKLGGQGRAKDMGGTRAEDRPVLPAFDAL